MWREEKIKCHIASHFSLVPEDPWFSSSLTWVFPACSHRVPGESTVLTLVTQTLPTSLLSQHCKLWWGRKPVSFQALKHPAKSADFTSSHGHLLHNSLNASGGQQGHTSAPAVSFLHWLSPASCQAPVLLPYSCLQAPAQGQSQSYTRGNHQSLGKQQGSDIHTETGNFCEAATQTRQPVPTLFRVEKGLPASLGAGQQLPAPHSHMGPLDAIFRCRCNDVDADPMFFIFISRQITLYLKVRNIFYFIPLSFPGFFFSRTGTSEGWGQPESCQRGTAPDSIAPHGGERDQASVPGSAAGQTWCRRSQRMGIAGRAGSSCNRANHIASCMLCADARHHGSAADWLLPVVNKKPSFHGISPGLFPNDALPFSLSRLWKK